jgi:hypothetical protein
MKQCTTPPTPTPTPRAITTLGTFRQASGLSRMRRVSPLATLYRLFRPVRASDSRVLLQEYTPTQVRRVKQTLQAAPELKKKEKKKASGMSNNIDITGGQA